jgi:hypothetical protein
MDDYPEDMKRANEQHLANRRMTEEEYDHTGKMQTVVVGTLSPEDVPPFVQIQAGHELQHLIDLIRLAPEPPDYFHSRYDAQMLIWRWALKWAKPMTSRQQL